MKCKPRPLNLDLAEAIDIIAPKQRGTGKPSIHSLPGFHDNVYVRMLAAKPKMDALTQRVYPSTLLTKVGVTPNHTVGIMSRLKPFEGARLWLSSSPLIEQIPPSIRGRLASKHRSVAKLKLDPCLAKEVLLSDIKFLLQKYLEHEPVAGRPTVCYTVSCRDHPSSIPCFDITNVPELAELNFPEEIRNGKYGLYLASCIFKYLYIYSSSNK